MENIETKVVHITEEVNIFENELQEAGQILRNGGLVAFPTETVYGIGANALDEQACLKIYKAKGRPSDNPLIMHISDIEWLSYYVSHISDTALSLIEAFWPGPLTWWSLTPSLVCGSNLTGIRLPTPGNGYGEQTRA